MASSSMLKQPLLSKHASSRLSSCVLDQDGVLYENDRGEYEDLSRRRRVVPESTEGRTRHLVVSTRSMDSQIPDTMFTDFKLVSDGKVCQGFRYWQENGNYVMADRDRKGSEMSKYMQVVTLNSWSNTLGFTVVNIVMVAVSKYATATFISTVSFLPQDDMKLGDYIFALALPIFFFTNILYQFLAAFLSAKAIWKRHANETGDLVQEDCHDEFFWAGRDPQEREKNKVKSINQFGLFISLWLNEYFMLPRTVKEAPIIFHNWKGSGEFASIKAEKARVQFVGHMTESAFQVGEIGNKWFFRRQGMGIFCDLVMTGLKWNIAMQTPQGGQMFFTALTIFLPLVVTVYTLYRSGKLYFASSRFQEALEKVVRTSAEDDPVAKTASGLLKLFYPQSSTALKIITKSASYHGTAVHSRKFAERLKVRLRNLANDLSLAELKLNVGHLADSLKPLMQTLDYFTEEPKADEEVQQAVERLRSSVLGEDVCICVLGSTKFMCPQSEELVKVLATELANGPLAGSVTFVTGGMAGVQKTFAENFGDGFRLWNLLPIGQKSGFKIGSDVHAGSNLDQRKLIISQLGHIYITVEGGPGVGHEARLAVENGAYIVPLMRTGGASAGACDFPASALEKPDHVNQVHWDFLANKEASVQESASAAAAIVALLATMKPWTLPKKSPQQLAPQQNTDDTNGTEERVDEPDIATTTAEDVSPSAVSITQPLLQRHAVPPHHWQMNQPNCAICNKRLLGRMFFTPKHHCRLCGKCVCGPCSRTTVDVDGAQQRCCSYCATSVDFERTVQVPV